MRFCGGRGQIEVADLPPEVAAMPVEASTPGPHSPKTGLELEAVGFNIERELIELAPERTKRNEEPRSAAAPPQTHDTLVEKIAAHR